MDSEERWVLYDVVALLFMINKYNLIFVKLKC